MSDKEYAYDGRLWIDPDEGTVTFTTRDGTRILRVTHLRKPTPDGVMIDMVSLPNLTSYTPIGENND